MPSIPDICRRSLTAGFTACACALASRAAVPPPFPPVASGFRRFAKRIAAVAAMIAITGPLFLTSAEPARPASAAADRSEARAADAPPPIATGAERGHPTEPTPDEVETIVRVQVYLDQILFTPGRIDGRITEFSRRAVAHYNTRFRIKPAESWTTVLEDARKVVDKPFIKYTIRPEDFNHVDTELPNELEELPGWSWLHYRRISEFVAERFHADEAFLYRINPGVVWAEVEAGDEVRVPNVLPFRIESIPARHSYPADPVLSSRHVIIDTTLRSAAIWDSEKDVLVACFPITAGSEQFIHRGDWELNNMMTTPEFRYDKSMLERGVRSGDYFMLPPGPNSPVGIIWCGTSRTGIGLHGTSSPDNIGESESAGCIRFSNWDAIRLPDLIRPGARITIR